MPHNKDCPHAQNPMDKAQSAIIDFLENTLNGFSIEDQASIAFVAASSFVRRNSKDLPSCVQIMRESAALVEGMADSIKIS